MLQSITVLSQTVARPTHYRIKYHLLTNDHFLKREVWCYSLGDFERAKELLYQIDWKHIIDETDVDISWRNWQSAFLNVVSVCVPRNTLYLTRNISHGLES